MSWADLTIDPDRVKALAEQRLLDRATKSFDATEITEERTAAAKDMVSRKLFDPKVGGHLNQYIATYGSRTLLLDAIADKEELASERAEMLAFAFLVFVLWQKRNTGRDVMAEDAERYEKELDSSIRAFESSAAFVLGQSTRTGGSSGGGAIFSSYTTYDQL